MTVAFQSLVANFAKQRARWLEIAGATGQVIHALLAKVSGFYDLLAMKIHELQQFVSSRGHKYPSRRPVLKFRWSAAEQQPMGT